MQIPVLSKQSAHFFGLGVYESVITLTVNDLVITEQHVIYICSLSKSSSRGLGLGDLFLGFALSGYSFHGLLDGFLISQELHRS